MLTFSAALVVTGCVSKASISEPGWRDLFDGSTLSGWELIGGDHPIIIADKAITGTAILNQPSAFLVTQERFDDFIFEAEFKVDGVLNSGIIFRAEVDSGSPVAGLRGYQLEIDPGPRAWTGGIYAEGLPWGWLYPPNLNPSCRELFNANRWNTFRVEAIGAELETFVNGAGCAKITDRRIASGKIALQFHGVEATGARGFAGDQVSWRNIRIATDNLESKQTVMPVSVPHYSFNRNQLTEWELANGWELLSPPLKTESVDDWEASDGVLTGRAGGKLDLLRLDAANAYELKLWFRFKDQSVGRVMYLETLPDGGSKTLHAEAIGFEIYGDEADTQSFLYTEEGRQMGALGDLVSAENLSEPLPIMRISPAKEWNRVALRVSERGVEQWLNSIKLIDIDFDAFRQSGLALRKSADITLEVESGEIEFANFKIRRRSE